MTLIENITYRGINVGFYRDVDFDVLINHSKDGSDGFIYCFIENWVKEVKKYNRNNKLKSIINGIDYSDFEWENINNEYICIYQSDGIDIEALYETIRKKVLQNHLPVSKYLQISEYSTGGAWKIEVGKSDD